MAVPKLSLQAQAETVRLIAEALPGTKKFPPQQIELLQGRADTVVRTMELFAKYEKPIRDLISVQMHLEANGGEGG